MRWLLILVLAGCGSTAAGERLTPDADPPPDASADVGTGSAGAGGVAGSAAGGAGGVSSGGGGGTGGVIATATTCLIPETAITGIASTIAFGLTGSKSHTAAECDQTYGMVANIGIYQGQVITGTPFSSGWTMQHYMITPSSDQTACAVNINFQCVGCGGSSFCGDASLEVTLSVPPQ